MSSAVIQQQRPSAPVPPAPPGPGLSPGDRGPDVSSYQPNVDWAQVAGAGYRFAFVKATESTNYTNPYFAQDWPAITANGLVRGAYHFARPADSSPLEQAAYFLAVVAPQAGDLLVLDFEVGDGDLSGWAIGFAQASQLPVMLYSGVPFMRAHGLDTPEVASAFGNTLWVAAYQANKPELPHGWPELTFWQFSDGEAVPGVQGACDCSIYLP